MALVTVAFCWTVCFATAAIQTTGFANLAFLVEFEARLALVTFAWAIGVTLAITTDVTCLTLLFIIKCEVYDAPCTL